MSQRGLNALLGTLALTIIAGCHDASGSDGVAAVLESHKREIANLQHVAGVGLGTCNDTPCIKIYAEQEDQRLLDELQRILGATPFEVIVADRFQTRPQ